MLLDTMSVLLGQLLICTQFLNCLSEGQTTVLVLTGQLKKLVG
jgi:hypothetical protein